MLGLAIELGRHADLLLLVVGMGLLYVASRAAVEALVPDGEGAPGWRAVGHHLPMAAVAVAGVALREPALAVGVLFGASVASLSLGVGSMAITTEGKIEAPAGWRRVWPFVVVVAVLAMLAGLSGTLTAGHAGIFLAEGLVLWLLWGERQGEAVKRRRVRPGMLALAVLLAGVGAWAAARGAVELSRGARAVTVGTVAATMLGPMLVLPMLGTGTGLAMRGMAGAGVTSQVGVVLLNLCLWLPVVIGATHLQAKYPKLAVTQATTMPVLVPTTVPATGPATSPATQQAGEEEAVSGMPKPALVFPIIVWRIDTVVLLVLGLVLLPAAIGRWSLGKRDGVIMIFVYVAYLMVVAAAGRR
jgi:hypothetical protein